MSQMNPKKILHNTTFSFQLPTFTVTPFKHFKNIIFAWEIFKLNCWISLQVLLAQAILLVSALDSTQHFSTRALKHVSRFLQSKQNHVKHTGLSLLETIFRYFFYLLIDHHCKLLFISCFDTDFIFILFSFDFFDDFLDFKITQERVVYKLFIKA